MHGDDVASAGTQIVTQTATEVIQTVFKVLLAIHETRQREKLMEKEFELKNGTADEVLGKQKFLSELKKNGETSSVTLLKEDFEQFKKINKDKYSDSIKYFDVEQGNDYVDLHYIKSDHDTVKNVLDQIMKEKIEKNKSDYSMTYVPVEKAETLQQIMMDNNIKGNLLECPDGRVKCTYLTTDEAKVKKAIEITDKTHESLSDISVKIDNSDKNKPKIVIMDIEQNKSYTMNFSDKERFEKVLEDKLNIDKPKAKAASAMFMTQMTKEQKRQFLSGSKITEKIEAFQKNIKVQDSSILVSDMQFSKIKVKELPEALAITDKDGNFTVITQDQSKKDIENNLKTNLTIDGDEHLKEIMSTADSIWNEKHEPHTLTHSGEYRIERKSSSIATISDGDRTVDIDLKDKERSAKILDYEFGMGSKKAEKVFDKAKKQSVTYNMLRKAQINQRKSEPMISQKNRKIGSRK